MARILGGSFHGLQPNPGATVARCGRCDQPESGALQLRYLQTLVEIAAEKHSTTIFPIPINTLAPFLKGLSPKQCGNPAFDL